MQLSLQLLQVRDGVLQVYLSLPNLLQFLLLLAKLFGHGFLVFAQVLVLLLMVDYLGALLNQLSFLLIHLLIQHLDILFILCLLIDLLLLVFTHLVLQHIQLVIVILDLLV